VDDLGGGLAVKPGRAGGHEVEDAADGRGAEADLQKSFELSAAAEDTTWMCNALRWLAGRVPIADRVARSRAGAVAFRILALFRNWLERAA